MVICPPHWVPVGTRALVAARLKPLFEEEARLRQAAGLRRGSDLPVTQNSGSREKHEKNRTSAPKAGELMKVSAFRVRAADKAQKQGQPGSSPLFEEEAGNEGLPGKRERWRARRGGCDAAGRGSTCRLLRLRTPARPTGYRGTEQPLADRARNLAGQRRLVGRRQFHGSRARRAGAMLWSQRPIRRQSPRRCECSVCRRLGTLCSRVYGSSGGPSDGDCAGQ